MDFFAVAVRIALSIAFTSAVVSYGFGHAGGVTKDYSGPMVSFDGHMIPLLESGDSVESKWVKGETIVIKQPDGMHLFRRHANGGEFVDEGPLGQTRLVPPGARASRTLASPSFLPPPPLPRVQGANTSAANFVTHPNGIQVFKNPAGIVFRSHTSHQGRDFPLVTESDVKNLGTGWDERSTMAVQKGAGINMIRFENNQWVDLGPSDNITFK